MTLDDLLKLAPLSKRDLARLGPLDSLLAHPALEDVLRAARALGYSDGAASTDEHVRHAVVQLKTARDERALAVKRAEDAERAILTALAKTSIP
jgi:hypothetical protein